MDAHCALGLLYTELFAVDEARGQFKAALTLARKLRSPTWTQALFGALAGINLLLEDYESTQGCLETAISPDTSMDTIGKRYCWVRKAELALVLGESDLALDITERLIKSAPGMSPGRVITFLWKLKGEALAASGREEDALSPLNSALENSQTTGERFLLWRIQACLGRLYYSMGDQQAAVQEINSAHKIIDELTATIADESFKHKFSERAYRILETSLPT